MIDILIVSLAVAAISITVTKGSIFSRVRLSVKKRSPLAGGLLSCSYCLAHWVAFPFIFVTSTGLKGPGVLVFIATWFALVGGSSLIIGLISRVLEIPNNEDAKVIVTLAKQLKEANQKLYDQPN